MSNEHPVMQHLSLEKTLATIPSGLFVVDMEMRIVYWNPAAERITGYSADEAIGQHCSFMRGIPCGHSCGLLDPKIPKPIIGANCSITSKTGQQISLLKNVEVLCDVDGEMIGGIESFNEITKQRQLGKKLRHQANTLEQRVKERTAELQRSESRFRAVLDSMDDWAYIADSDYTLTFMNRAMVEIFGQQSGNRCHKVLHHRETTCPWCPMERVLNNRTVRNDLEMGDKGQVYEIIHSPLPNEDGKLEKLAVCRNITKRTLAENALREANRELDAFAHSVSHDLRGILSPVVTYMDFLRMTYHEVFDEQVLQILKDVELQGERAIALLDALLDLARVGHVPLSQHPTDVKMLAMEIVAEYGAEEEAEKPRVSCGELPSSWVPETLVYQLLSNLIGNARNYARAGDQPIEVGCWKEKGRKIYFVRDHGPGIPNEEKESVFEIFYRGKKTREIRGNGIGLAIVRKIAMRCNGQVWVEDTPGGGATVCVALPEKPSQNKPADGLPRATP